MKKNFIKGTLILTSVGIISRIAGFLFKIILSREIGSAGVGLYQLVMPVLTVCSAIGISGFEICVSRCTARYSAKDGNRAASISVICMILSVFISIFCCIVVYFSSGFLSKNIFHNAESQALINILLLSIPFSAVHSIIYSYYIGRESVVIPALSQLFEQIIRIGAIFGIVAFCRNNGMKCGPSTGIYALVAGEMCAAIFCVLMLFFRKNKKKHRISCTSSHLKEIFKISVPVSGNRVCLHILQCVETALIPLMLQTYGYSEKAALSFLGVVTGMTLPIILFPCTLSNSVSLMLLPAVSKNQDSTAAVKRNASKAFTFSICFGLFCIIFFMTVGSHLGSLIFNEPSVNLYAKVLCWICPFVFLSGTFRSMLNALGKTTNVFADNMISELVSLLFVVFAIPRFGIYAYLLGLLTSQILNSLLHVRTLYSVLKKKS